MVSHDRALIDAVATRTLAIEGTQLVSRDGGWGDLLQARAEERASAPGEGTGAQSAKSSAGSSPAPAKKSVKAPAGGAKERSADRPGKGGTGRQIRQLETKIQRLESELAAVNAELIRPEVLGDPAQLVALGETHRRVQEEIAWALANWEKAAESAGA